MVSLPELASYQEQDWLKLRDFSPVSGHYRQLLNSPPTIFADQLRLQRHHHWLKCSLATFIARLPPQQICQYWSRVAEEIVLAAWQHVGLTDSSIHLFAAGKLGSFELNMSSDVDLMFVRSAPDQSAKELQKVKEFIRLISDSTARGFCFRVDTDLRPGGQGAPLIPDIDSFIHFYGYRGEAWQRISLIRLRPLVGPQEVRQRIVKFCQDYSYPRRMDYLIIESMRNLLQKFHRESATAIDLKLAPGGIRDIELFVQAKQVIFGGRKDELRVAPMSEAITKLVEHNILPREDGAVLDQFYWHLRLLENSLQLSEDRHTYLITESIYQKLNLPNSFSDLAKKMAQTSQIVHSFFAREDEYQDKIQDILQDVEVSSRTKDSLSAIMETTDRLRKSDYVDRSRRQLISRFYDHAVTVDIDKDLALETFHDFLRSVKSDSSIYYILNNNHEICEKLAWLFSFSPYVGRLLASRPELLDSFALGSVEINPFQDDLQNFLEDLLDYKLLNHLASTAYFLESLDVWSFVASLSESADTIAQSLFTFLGQNFATENVDILCLGKWGGRELGTHSDLDFVFVTESAPQAHDFQIAKRFTNLVSNHSRGGRLFNIDLRLKPNNQAGPLIVERMSLVRFIADQSEPWQKQAYLKSRSLKKKTGLYDEVTTPITLTDENFLAITRILQQLLKPASPQKIDLKYAPGGLVHTEFILQKLILENWPWNQGPAAADQFHYLANSSSIKGEIWQNYSKLRQIEQLFAICTDLASTTIVANHSSIPRLERALGVNNFFAMLTGLISEQSRLLEELDRAYFGKKS